MTDIIYGFNLDKLSQAIVSSIQNALETIMPEIMVDNNFEERDGYGQFRWNAIIAQLREKCQYLGRLELGICRRGGWKTPVLFDPISRNILTFMTESTFKVVQRKVDKGKHYLYGGASYNYGVEAAHEQLTLDLSTTPVNMGKWIAKSREQLSNAVRLDVGDITGHILVLFDVRVDKLISVRAVRLTPALEISTEQEDWSKYITNMYLPSQLIAPQSTTDDEEEELVELL